MGQCMVRRNAEGLVLSSNSEEFIFLARRVSYTTDDWQAEARHLQSDIAQHMGKTREFLRGACEGYEGKRPGAFLARGTRTIRMCSFDARSRRQPWPLPPEGG
jgi:hypothetical protein